MRTPSVQLASLLASTLNDLDHDDDLVHPTFREIVEHAAEPLSYLTESRDDPNPLTDLRVRYDESSRHMLHTNVLAMAERYPQLPQRIESIAEADSTLRSLQQMLKLRQGARYRWPDDTTDAYDHSHELTAMYLSVNAFGGWDDAEEIANTVLRSLAHGSRIQSSHTLGVSALVMALRGCAGYGRLFEESFLRGASSVEVFFYGLRWASIEAKRNSNLNGANEVLERTLRAYAEKPVPEDGDAETIKGMTNNFRALLAMRSNDFEGANSLAESAVEELEIGWAAETSLAQPEKSRYVWMAMINRAQLAWFAQEFSLAIERFEEALRFASEHDPRAVHSSSSLLAFSHLQQGAPQNALSYARKAVRLSQHEYDPQVAVQVRKLLLRCFMELDMKADAANLIAEGPYYWRNETTA